MAPAPEEAPPIVPGSETAPEQQMPGGLEPEAAAAAAELDPIEDLPRDKTEADPDDSGREPESAAAVEAPLQDDSAAPAPAPPSTKIPAPKPILRRQREALTYGIASDAGVVRDNNEDASFGMQWHSITVDERPDFGLFIVADGMGGHLDGERASGVAVQTLAAEMLDSIYVPMLKNFNAGSSPTILEALINASEKANQAVIKSVPGGGTTLTAVAIVGNLAYVVHVGDSRAYLLHEDKIEQLTTDHTLVQRLIEMNELTLEEAEHYPQKNVLYRAIGQNEQLKMERLIRTLPPASKVLICTDGLWDLVEDESIESNTAEAKTPQEACDRLVQLAKDRGGTDNITAIMFRVPAE
jgi:serine/threonine protein phosphatase PrpC